MGAIFRRDFYHKTYQLVLVEKKNAFSVLESNCPLKISFSIP